MDIATEKAGGLISDGNGYTKSNLEHEAKRPHQPPHLSGETEPLADRMMTGPETSGGIIPSKSRQDAPFMKDDSDG